MKIILSSRRHHYVARLSIFLITVALIAGMAGCVPEECDLTIASTAGGKVIKPGEGTSTHLKGELVSLVADPDEGYRFVRWLGDVRDIAHVKDPSTTITVKGNYSITANFEEIPEYELTISSTAGGNVTTPGEGTFTYKAGTEVALVADRDVGYGFVEWTGDVDNIDNDNVEDAVTTITMEGNYEITANFTEEKAVTFTDPNLEDAIREEIDIDGRPIYPSDLKVLYRLDTEEWNVSDLTGLEHCTELTRLDLYNKQIDDISPLVNLTSLTNLDLESNQTSDISPLANLKKLRYLSLGANQISDISSLADLKKLITLSLGGNQISDISSLADLESLTHLYLGGNQISDISPLANLTKPTKLTYLSLGNNQISDISPLAKLTSLANLSLGSNQISDISHLANLTSLTNLSLGGNNISDISHLANLTSLTNLSLELNQISDISPLANLTKLKELNLSYNQISDIEPLVNNTGLSEEDSEEDEVDLWKNPLSFNSTSIYIPQLQARGVKVQY
jgi:Leucine-rich repeat (LRR) protein